MYKVSLNLLGNVTPHSQMIININRSSKIHGNQRSFTRAKKADDVGIYVCNLRMYS